MLNNVITLRRARASVAGQIPPPPPIGRVLRKARIAAVGIAAILALTVLPACEAPAEETEQPAPAVVQPTNTSPPAAAATAPAAGAQPANTPVPTTGATVPTAGAQPANTSPPTTGATAPTAVPRPTNTPAPTPGVPVHADLRVALNYGGDSLLGLRLQRARPGILQPMQEALFQRDYQDWSAQPMLATSWSVSPDGREWTINLREDVPFHHGEDTFGVSDFVFSFQLWSHPEAHSNRHSSWLSVEYFRGFGDLWDDLLGPDGDKRSFEVEALGTASTVTEVSDSQMVWNMNRPELWIPFYASEATPDALIYSLDYWEKNGEAAYAETPVGTGPWQYVSHIPGGKLEYERVPYEHWRITPDFETLTFLFVGEENILAAILSAGEADIAEIPRELQSEIIDAGFAITQSTLPAFMVWVGIGGQYLEDKRDPNDPNTNLLVRRAMNHAIDRHAINEAFFDNKMELMANTGWHPTDPSYNPEWEIPAYDPDLSKRLLAEAGYEEGSGPSIERTSYQPLGETYLVMRPWLEEVGFTIEDDFIERISVWSKAWARDMNSVLWQHSTGFWPAGRNMGVYFVSPGPAGAFNMYRHPAQTPPIPAEETGAFYMYEDPFTDDLFRRWQSSVDEAERLDLMKKAGQHLYEQNATIPLGFLFAEFAINPEVVAEYSVNNSYFGAMKGHEYTRVVRR